MSTDINEGQSPSESDANRRQHLDTSQWPTALGYDPLDEPVNLFGRLVGVLPLSAEEGDDAEIGDALVPSLVALASKRLGREFARTPAFVHPRYPWCTSRPDGIDHSDGALCLVSTTGVATDDDRDDVDEWGSDEGDVPRRVLTHAMGDMTVLRAWQIVHGAPLTKETHIAVLAGGRARGFRHYRVEWDEALARRLFDRVVRFWGHVQEGTPPPPHDTEAFYRFLERRYPKHEEKKWVDADEYLTQAVRDWEQLDLDIEDLKRRRLGARNQICRSIRDAEGIRGGEGATAWRLPWRFKKGAARLDPDLLKTTLHHLLGAAETERIFTECTKTSAAGHRQLGPTWRPKNKTDPAAKKSTAERMKEEIAEITDSTI